MNCSPMNEHERKFIFYMLTMSENIYTFENKFKIENLQSVNGYKQMLNLKFYQVYGLYKFTKIK